MLEARRAVSLKQRGTSPGLTCFGGLVPLRTFLQPPGDPLSLIPWSTPPSFEFSLLQAKSQVKDSCQGQASGGRTGAGNGAKERWGAGVGRWDSRGQGSDRQPWPGYQEK